MKTAKNLISSFGVLSLLAPAFAWGLPTIRIVETPQKKEKPSEVSKREETLVTQAWDTIHLANNFCKKLSWKCEQFASPEIILTDEAILSSQDNESVAGNFIPSDNTIEVSLHSRNVQQTLFHELIHWAHFHHLGEPEWFANPPSRFEWVLEAVPFLAYLQSPLSDPSLTAAEAEFIGKDLSGSLFSPASGGKWYGLIGLWTRYLALHVTDPMKLLQDWADLTPSSPPFESANYLLTGEAKRALSFEDKNSKNLFEYFALALIENSRGINEWNLFEIGSHESATPILAESTRWSTFTNDAAVNVSAGSFFFVLPQSLPQESHFEAKGELRVLLWRGTRHPPVDLLKNPLPAERDGGDRILVYNPGDLSESLILKR